MAERKIDKKIRDFDADFASWLQQNPGGKFSEFATGVTRTSLEKGIPHATLGPALKTEDDWRKGGIQAANRVFEWGSSDEHAKICDYGCGSLRVGLHIMGRQGPGCYYGIDVSPYLIDVGAGLVGDALLQEKRPMLGTIDDKLQEVIAANIDVVFTFNVASHIHPSEQQQYISNLKAICHKPGSRVLLHAIIHPEPIRFQQSGWGWPMEQYVSWLEPLRLVGDTLIATADKHGVELEGRLLTFERLDTD
ncbi:class I SAM-dependent methyltransferase [Pararhizobium sp. O133]|uniref:class I SAM-dependent methyltransferase n=1 Tax=Pararhizobium sp. O133 TaxID=3449278 RepID=UPI003F683105